MDLISHFEQICVRLSNSGLEMWVERLPRFEYFFRGVVKPIKTHDVIKRIKTIKKKFLTLQKIICSHSYIYIYI